MYRLFAILLMLLTGTNTEEANFPTLYIESYENPFTVEREYWHDGVIRLTGADIYDIDYKDARLRGRGNSTWAGGWNDTIQKRPLRIRFPEGDGSFFGSYEHRDWILLANAFDPTAGLRTSFALDFATFISDEFVTSFHFVNLNVNGVDMGVYQLVDERDIGPGRGTVVIHEDPEISEYWLELDFRSDDFEVNGHTYDMRYPSGSAQTEGHIEYAENFITRVSEAIRSRVWEDIIELIDVYSMVNFYLLQELVRDSDEGMTSTFMTIRGAGEDRRLFMGPFWDFDLTLGNVGTYDLGNYNPEGIWAAYANYWFYNLMAVSEFRVLVRDRWNEVKDTYLHKALLNLVYTASVYRSEFKRNFEIHDILGSGWLLPSGEYEPVQSHITEIETFSGQVEYLINFILRRAHWLDSYFNRPIVIWSLNLDPTNFNINAV